MPGTPWPPARPAAAPVIREKLPPDRALATQILELLTSGARTKWQLRDLLVVNETRLYRALCWLRDQGEITRSGTRRRAIWALVGEEPATAKKTLPFEQFMLPKPAIPRHSWWVKPSDDGFSDAAKQRAREMGWQ